MCLLKWPIFLEPKNIENIIHYAEESYYSEKLPQLCNYDLQCESKAKAAKRKFPRRESNLYRDGESAES